MGNIPLSVDTQPPDFCIIANNCWGAEVYRHYRRPYNTPVVGLYFYPEDYLRFISELRKNLTAPLTFVAQSRHLPGPAKYPVGVVNGIEVHFLHYRDEAEATDKWTRRCARVPTDDSLIYFKFDDRDGATIEHVRDFLGRRLPRSICFSRWRLQDPAAVFIPMPQAEPSVMDGYALYYEGVRHFDLHTWVCTGRVTRGFSNRLNTWWRNFRVILKG